MEVKARNWHPPLNVSVSARKAAKASGAVSHRVAGAGGNQVAGRNWDDGATALVAPVLGGDSWTHSGSRVSDESVKTSPFVGNAARPMETPDLRSIRPDFSSRR